jgi:preprotein translocase subunit SecE
VINNCLLKDFLLFLSEATQKSVKIIWPGRYDLVQTQILNVFFLEIITQYKNEIDRE